LESRALCVIQLVVSMEILPFRKDYKIHPFILPHTI